MKRMLLMGAPLLVLALAVTAAEAGGINLSWSNCGTLGTANRSFACNTNSTAAPSTLVISYMPPPGITSLVRMEAVLDLQSASSTLPPWWSFRSAGSCRQTALSATADFTTVSGCADYWQGGATGAVPAYTTPSPRPGAGPNTARIWIYFALPTMDAGPVNSQLEYYGARITINNMKTIGTPSCAGCLDPVCIVLNEVQLAQDFALPGVRLQTPIQRNWVTWQGGIVAGGCPAATPARNHTWGAVKAMYR